MGRQTKCRTHGQGHRGGLEWRIYNRQAKYESIQDQIKESGQEQVSTTDAKAVILHRGVVNVGYNVQASVDAKNKLITHFDTGDVNDTNALASVAIATKELLQVEAMDVLADKGYHTGEQLAQCISENINTFVSPKEPASNDEDIFPVTAFIYNPDNDTYTCPAGEPLTEHGLHTAARTKSQLISSNVTIPVNVLPAPCNPNVPKAKRTVATLTEVNLLLQ